MTQITKKSETGLVPKNNAVPVRLKYKLKKATFIDQFGNEVEGVPCNNCPAIGLEKDFRYFNNYGGIVRKSYLCDTCFDALASVSDRVTRDRKKIPHAFLVPTHNGSKAMK